MQLGHASTSVTSFAVPFDLLLGLVKLGDYPSFHLRRLPVTPFSTGPLFPLALPRGGPYGTTPSLPVIRCGFVKQAFLRGPILLFISPLKLAPFRLQYLYLWAPRHGPENLVPLQNYCRTLFSECTSWDSTPPKPLSSSID